MVLLGPGRRIWVERLLRRSVDPLGVDPSLLKPFAGCPNRGAQDDKRKVEPILAACQNRRAWGDVWSVVQMDSMVVLGSGVDPGLSVYSVVPLMRWA